MFQTPSDIATHQEPWASILRIGLREAAVRVCGHLASPDELTDFEAKLFNRLTSSQKVAMLAIVGQSLLDHSVPAPPLTAVVDSTLTTILDSFRITLVVEADSDGWRDGQQPGETDDPITECRAALLRLLEPEWDEKEFGMLPHVESCNYQVWEGHADMPYFHLLYDYDSELEDEFVDLPPKEAKRRMGRMGIDDDYFSTPAPDPTPAELRGHIAKLEELTGEALDIECVRD